MSSNGNNDNDHSAIGAGLAVIGVGMIVMVLLIYAVAVFAALALSVFCLFAWNEDVTLGSWTMRRDEARAFIGRGLFGAFLTPVFLVFCEMLFSVRINPDYLIHFVLGGYAAGSLGFEIMKASAAEAHDQASQFPVSPPPPQIAPPKRFIHEEPAPFRFASWDDEEERS